MPVAGSTSWPLALALGLLALAAPLAHAQAPPPTADGSDTAQSPPDAPSDQDGAAPAAEPRIDQPFGHAWLGAADGDVILIVFADYACPGCREAQPVIDQLMAQDHKLKVVYRLLDNDQGGRTAALTSLAVAQESVTRASVNWGRFHHALDAAGEPTSKAIAEALAAAGVEPGKAPALGAEDPQTLVLVDELSRNDNLITQRSGTAIPAWVIGDGPAQKGFDLPRLQAAIAQARAARTH